MILFFSVRSAIAMKTKQIKQFIELYKNEPALWNQSHEEYRVTDIKEAAELRIATNMGNSIGLCPKVALLDWLAQAQCFGNSIGLCPKFSNGHRWCLFGLFIHVVYAVLFIVLRLN